MEPPLIANVAPAVLIENVVEPAVIAEPPLVKLCPSTIKPDGMGVATWLPIVMDALYVDVDDPMATTTWLLESTCTLVIVEPVPSVTVSPPGEIV